MHAIISACGNPRILAEALAYQALGMQVFPLHTMISGACSCGEACKSPGKHPRTSHGFKDATADPEQVRKWWRIWPSANVGIVTGATSGIVVVDVDPRHGGDATLAQLLEAHGPLPATVEAVTGGGGRHIVFQHPGEKVSSAQDRLGPGVDVKGDGGYIVAAPSLHASGRRYEWAPGRAPGEVGLAPLPGWLLDVMREPSRPRPSAAPARPRPRPTPSSDLGQLDQINEGGVAAAAAVLGIEERPRGGWGPCPACGWEGDRGSRDPRGPVGIRGDDRGWACHQCKISGSAVDLLACRLFGAKLGKGDRRWRELIAEGERLGLCVPPAPGRRIERLPAEPQTFNRPPRDEVEDLWRICRAVTEDPQALAWLDKRGIDAGDVEAQDLARALPADGLLPQWARSWARAHRLIVPLFGASGEIESLHARRTDDEASDRKSLAPYLPPPSPRLEVGGLVMADPLGRLLLSRAELGDGSPAAEAVRRFGLIVAEGEPAWLGWACNWSDANEEAPAVLGIVGGSWTQALAETVPNGARVIVRVDDDRDGWKYADQVRRTLAGRCEIFLPTRKAA